MQDRIPTPGQEGRALITPEDGSAPYYATIEMADNPTNPGTPLNKDSLLKDATAALFKLGADAVPDDVLSILSKAAILVDCNLELPNGSPVPQVKIETGSYVGTGTSGSSNPNTLTASGHIKAAFISRDDAPAGTSVPMINPSHTAVASPNTDSANSISVTWGDKNVSFYASSAINQLNANGVTYGYLLIL